MSETICVTSVNTTLNEAAEPVRLSPWRADTYVVCVSLASSDMPENSRSRGALALPEEVDIQEWMEAMEYVLEFWDNDEDAVYDNY